MAVKNGVVDASLLAMAAVWGSSYLTVKDVAAAMPIMALLAVRFLLSTASLLVVGGRTTRLVTAAELRYGLYYGVLQSIVLYLEAWGVTRTSAANGGLIISLAIILIPIYENAAQRRWLPTPFYLSTVGAFVGVVLLVNANPVHRVTAGDVAFLVAAVGRTLYFGSLSSRLWRYHLDTTRFNLVACAVSAVLFTTAGWSATWHCVGHLSLGTWGGLLYLSLVSTVVGFLVQTWAIKRTSAARASLLMATEPLWSTAIAITIGGERLATLGVVGAVILLTSTFAGQRTEAAFRSAAVTA